MQAKAKTKPKAKVAKKAKKTGKSRKKPKPPPGKPPSDIKPQTLAQKAETQQAVKIEAAAQKRALLAQFPQFTYFDTDGNGTIDR